MGPLLMTRDLDYYSVDEWKNVYSNKLRDFTDLLLLYLVFFTPTFTEPQLLVQLLYIQSCSKTAESLKLIFSFLPQNFAIPSKSFVTKKFY